MGAREFYYQSLIDKQNRDARNPIMEQAVAGWQTGIQGALKSKQENDTNLRKGLLDSAIKQRGDRADLAKEILSKSDVYLEGKINNSMEVINLAYQEMVTGQPSGKNITVKLRVKDVDKARAEYYRSRAEGGSGTPPYATRTYEDPETGEKLTEKGFTEEVEIPAVPAVEGKPLPYTEAIPFINKIKFGGKPAQPAGVATQFAPARRGQIFNRQPAPVAPTTVQSQAPQQPKYQVGQVLNTPKGQIRIIGFDTDGTPLIEPLGR